MKKIVLATMMATFGSIALAGVVAACSSHGTSAGNHFASWVASNAGGSSSVTQSGNVQASGSEDGVAGANGWANSEYWIDIVMPDGTEVTVRTYATAWADTSMAGQLEAWLFDQAQAKLRSWFNDYEPVDVEGDDYCG